MRSVRTASAVGVIAEVALLAGLTSAVGLDAPGWVVGMACALVTSGALARTPARGGPHLMGPANWVTLTRATIVGGVAALVTDSFSGPAPVTTLVALAVIALLLDALDGWVARRTRTVSSFGARFDLEVDAFLILVLSVYVAGSSGSWVLAIGAARYAFVAARWLLPWLRGTVPPRHWCKVVAAIQGITLTFAAADLVPRLLTNLALLVALALLAESFGREIWLLWRHRGMGPDQPSPPPPADDRATSGTRGPVRRVGAGVVTLLACLLVWVALVAPDRLSRLTPAAFVRIPIEGLLVVGVALVLPVAARRAVALLVGVVLGLLSILKVLDIGFFATFDRPFNPVIDRGTFGPAAGVLSDSIGRNESIAVEVTLVAMLVAVMILMPLSVLRLTRVASQHRTRTGPAVLGLGVVWLLCAVSGVQAVPGAPVASTSAVVMVYDEVNDVHAAVLDQRVFDKEIVHDPLRRTPADDLLTGLRGKDVIIAFVESYGRDAVQGSTFSPQVDSVLDAGTRRLQSAGFTARSAFLTSPTFGGMSWLAHSTLQSGLWVDNQARYDELLGSDRFTLSAAFKRAGWRTVSDVPSDKQNWPEGRAFYGYDTLYDTWNVGYVGPRFAYAHIPDQYTLAAFQRLELSKADRPPVMAEIDLVSSHTPWAPLPHMVAWADVGFGAVFDPMPAQGRTADEVWRDSDQVRAQYGKSIVYSLNSLISFVQHYGDKNLVLVMLGDHQPATIVTGEGASHDVPITVIAHDPAVLDRISGWRWEDGMRPDPHAPVWPMSAFRDRFLAAYGPQPVTTPPATSFHPPRG